MDTNFTQTLFLWLAVFLTRVGWIEPAAYPESPSMNSVLKYLSNQNYDRFVPPGQYNGRNEKTTVHVGIYINSISSINEIAMDVDLDIFLRMWWMDPRLREIELTDAQIMDADDLVPFIWTPGMFFLNGKLANYHKITEWNMSLRFSNGSIFNSVRVTVKLHCPMRLNIFPMDRQNCDVYMESYAVRIEELEFRWTSKDPVELNDNLQLPRFNISSVPVVYDCVQKYRTGKFSCLCMSIPLEREIGYYVIQVYIPSMLVVIISWLSFFLSPDAVAARTSLGVVTVLTVTTQNSNVNQSIPKVSYVKAIDVWHATCLAFVFASLMEFAVANSLRRRELRKKSKAERLVRAAPEPAHQRPHADTEVEEMDDKTIHQMQEAINIPRSRRRGNRSIIPTFRAKTLDYASRIFFPVMFMIFNAIYWPYYLRSNMDTGACNTS